MDICTDNERSPLYHACRNGHFECAEFLINKGVNLNRRNDSGDSPLSAAAHRGHSECVELLAQHGADMDLPDYEGHTPLFLACNESHLKCVVTLIEYGADVNMGDHSGRSPAFIATKHGFLDILCLLLRSGADINTVTHDGWSLAFVAAMGGHTDCLDYLMANGIDIEQYIQSSIQLEHLLSAEDFSRNFAATRIQNCFRSCSRKWRTRELVLDKKRAAACAVLERQVRIARTITRMQARFRGINARRMLREAHDYYEEFVRQEHDVLHAETERVAATHIQALFRGVYVRSVLRSAFMGYVAETGAEAAAVWEAEREALARAEFQALREAEEEAKRLETERLESERLAAEAAAAERVRLQEVLRAAAVAEREKQDRVRQGALAREESARGAAKVARAVLEEAEESYAQLARQEAEEELAGHFPLEQRQRQLLEEMTFLMALKEELDTRRAEVVAYEAERVRQVDQLAQVSKVSRTRAALVCKAEAAHESESFRLRLQLLAEEAVAAEAVQTDVVKFTNAAVGQEQKRLEAAERLVASSEQRVSLLEAGITAHRPGAVIPSPCKTVAGHTPVVHSSLHMRVYAAVRVQALYRGFRARRRAAQTAKESGKATEVNCGSPTNVISFTLINSTKQAGLGVQ